MSTERSLREIRLDKLRQLRELGCDPYGVERFERSHEIGEVVAEFDRLVGQSVRLAGRVTAFRLMGKAAFADISYGPHRIQLYLRRDDLGETGWGVANLLDVGDHIGIEGETFVTKTGENSVHVRQITPLSKSLHTLPVGKEKDGEAWYRLADTETRYRHRHLDLIGNPDARERLIQRSRITSAVRRFFDARDYLEVETPMLQVEAGGAAARTFRTRYNAYDMDVDLRISLELYLKRLICGDLGKVYEIGRVFRNEGVSNRHNPEFTLLEFYEAYANLEDMMTVVEELFRFVAREVFGAESVRVEPEDGEPIVLDFSRPWQRVSLLDEIERRAGISAAELSELATAKAAMERVGLPTEKEGNLGGIIEKLLERFVEPHLIDPTFVVGYPIETSPLAKKDPTNPRMTRRFEGYVRGREVCNAFSEINDPLDQRERFEFQVSERRRGDHEAHPMDEEYLFALECGMPPTGGCGIGIDRMALLLTGAEHVREVLLFPMMKPEAAT